MRLRPCNTPPPTHTSPSYRPLTNPSLAPPIPLVDAGVQLRDSRTRRFEDAKAELVCFNVCVLRSLSVAGGRDIQEGERRSELQLKLLTSRLYFIRPS
jgi:hypothetical protein